MYRIAAVRLADGRVFTGTMHVEAMRAAGVDLVCPPRDMEEGFVINGRFYEYEAGLKLLNSSWSDFDA